MTAIFPYLPGLAFPVDRVAGNWDTTREVAVSGKEVRYANRTQARRKYTVDIEGLDSSGKYSSITTNSLQQLEAFFNSCFGSALIFNFWDVDDNTVTGQQFGTGDGATTAFQLVRTASGYVDNIFAPLTAGGTITVPSANGGTTSAPYSVPAIYAAGTLVSSANYSITNGLVTFNTAPASGAALTVNMSYYWPCNFDDDSLALSKFMYGLYEAKKLSFTTRIF